MSVDPYEAMGDSADILSFPIVPRPRPELKPTHGAAQALMQAREDLSHALVRKNIALPVREALALDAAIDKAIEALVYDVKAE